MKSIRFAALLLLITNTVFLSSCLKKNFDSPPDQSSFDPHLAVNKTIAQLNAIGNNNIPVTSDMVISGIVTADDRSGNFYKQIVIGDSTGGITVLLDQNSLYNDYPVGRKVYIKCKGLYMGNYHGLPQLGYTPDNTGTITPIPSGIIGNYVIQANYPNVVPVKTVSLADIASTNTSLLNCLVHIDDVEFMSSSASQPYAQPASVSSGSSQNIEDCNGSIVILRTSGYAYFQPLLTPAGKGGITAIYTTYGTSPQLVIRDTTDVKFNGTRCSGSVIGSIVSLDSILNLYTGTDVTLGAAKVAGVVISDAANKNISTGSLVLQSGNRGVSIYFGGAITYNPGDSIVLDVTGGTLTSYKGSLEIKPASSTQPVAIAHGKTVTPQQVTLSQLAANFSNLEYTLIKVVGATASPSGSAYSSSNVTLDDGSGAPIKLYTATAATFGSQILPSGTHTWVGYVNTYNTTQEFMIRNESDVQ